MSTEPSRTSRFGRFLIGFGAVLWATLGERVVGLLFLIAALAGAVAVGLPISMLAGVPVSWITLSIVGGCVAVATIAGWAGLKLSNAV
ncbi:MAG: hypothetical protein AAGD32_10315 [Planctomycetota bacterium]